MVNYGNRTRGKPRRMKKRKNIKIEKWNNFVIFIHTLWKVERVTWVSVCQFTGCIKRYECHKFFHFSILPCFHNSSILLFFLFFPCRVSPLVLLQLWGTSPRKTNAKGSQVIRNLRKLTVCGINMVFLTQFYGILVIWHYLREVWHLLGEVGSWNCKNILRVCAYEINNGGQSIKKTTPASGLFW